MPGRFGTAPVVLGRAGVVAWLAAAGLSLWIRTGMGIHAIGTASLDDGLFVRLARSIGTGQWLGTFDHTTLVKGVFYPLFILAAFLAGIPLKVAEHGAYLLAAACVSLLVVRAGRDRVAGTLLFVLLAFNPMFWNAEGERVIREGLYVSLSLALVGLLGWLLVPARRHWGLGLLLGLVAGGFWLTREEGIWLLPALLVLAVAALAARGVRPVLATATGPLLLAALGCAVVIGGVMALNQRFYGAPLTVEVKAASFEHAYGAIARIGHARWSRYIVFPKDARTLAYAVSPAARELQPSLDGENGENWRLTGCRAMPGTDCSDIQASWFQWALRDAVAAAGHYRSWPEAAAYYDRLAGEIDAACNRGAIPCLPPRATLAPPFRWHYLEDAAWAGARLLPILLQLGGRDVEVRASEGPEALLDLFADTVGPVNREPVPLTELRGWVGSTAGPPSLALRPALDTDTRTDLTLSPGTDLLPKFPGWQMLRFDLSTDCPPAACALVVSAGGRDTVLKLAGLAQPGRTERPEMLLNVDAAGQRAVNRGTDRRSAAVARLARPIGWAYALAMPVLAALGLAGVLLAMAIRRAEAWRSPLFALAASSLVAVGCRVALLAYLDVTSIPSVRLLYASPAGPFVIVLAVAGCACAIRALRPRMPA